MISNMQKVNQEPIARAELKVNGKEIKLNNFVESFISQTIIGMVKSLRGVGDIETVDLRVSKKSE
jgi:hypothetical protein